MQGIESIFLDQGKTLEQGWGTCDTWVTYLYAHIRIFVSHIRPQYRVKTEIYNKRILKQ